MLFGKRDSRGFIELYKEKFIEKTFFEEQLKKRRCIE